MSIDDDLKNGVAPGIMEAAANVGMKSPVVQLLEQLLAQAKIGQIDTVATIAVGSDGSTRQQWAGKRLGDVLAGTNVLQFMIVSTLLNPQPRGRIVRPGHG